ncbi:MAG: hypothetical protein AAGF01_12565 [Cyanobacteria bacterium P01_G01_bin.38]
MKRKIWITEAAPEEQGNFCDTKSGHAYGNRAALATEIIARTAPWDGTEVIFYDGPELNLDPDKRFNLAVTMEDSQGIPFSPDNRTIDWEDQG